MRMLLSIFVLITVLLGAVSKTWIYSHYRMNYETYAKVLCENKNKPSLHCDGKCQLKKELKQQEKDENQSLPKEVNLDLFFQKPDNFQLSIDRFKKATPLQPVPPLLAGTFLSVFQPPEA